MKICIVGPAHPLRGGLASFNERLATQFQNEGHEVQMITFKLQYPKLLFPGKTQFTNSPKPDHLNIDIFINSVNPINWIKTVRKIKSYHPDLLIIRYWTPFMAPCLGTIARLVKRRKKTKVICLVDNLIPHEKHFIDSFLTHYFVKGISGFVTMSQSVFDDVAHLKIKAPILLTPHPMFDNFGKSVPKEEALMRLNLSSDYKYLLYFGLIRNYKGLDLLIEAFGNEQLRSFPYKLIIAGEFYEDPIPYYELIKKHQLSDFIELRTEFIPNNLVADYFSISDLIVLPYKNATQSGVTQIAYHFSKPMLVTNVGGLPEIVKDGVSGYVVNPTVESITSALIEFCVLNDPNHFSNGINIERKRFEWNRMTQVFYTFAENK
jgi:D-inositol-3-phosphate glycosyltransferase